MQSSPLPAGRKVDRAGRNHFRLSRARDLNPHSIGACVVAIIFGCGEPGSAPSMVATDPVTSVCDHWLSIRPVEAGMGACLRLGGGRGGSRPDGEVGDQPSDAGASAAVSDAQVPLAPSPPTSPVDAGPVDAGVRDAPDAEERCDIAGYDPAEAPTVLELRGSLAVHDPAVIVQDQTLFLFHTGPGLPAKRSDDLLTWRDDGHALEVPGSPWFEVRVPGSTDPWAPDVAFFDGQFHLYYSVSTPGSNRSCIGHATRDTLTAGGWTDHGPVVCSDTDVNWNAIDPHAHVDLSGRRWLVFGSYWDGIKAVELDAGGMRVDDDGPVYSLASRQGDSIGAPFVVRRCGYYYLFVTFGVCCEGVDSTAHIRVGRSVEFLGPYVDRQGIEMMRGGGTVVVEGAGRWHGPGQNAVVFALGGAYNLYHAYDSDNAGRPFLRIAELVWDDEGWPLSGGP